ncbi:MAG: ferrous iron transport protein B, partial [Deltaproteobacteria bacterium]|nr:ferrous iron transport protein B [Deltaproteobacteria bacterium]
GTEPFSKIIDTPGFYSLQERSEDALVVRDLLSRKLVGGVLLVLDAKNLRRGLSLAFELAEFQVPLIIALNMHDEARQRGVEINIKRLSELLGVPIIPTVATEGRGLNQLKKALRDARAPKIRLEYPDVLRHLVEEIEVLLAGRNMPIGGIAYLLSMDLTSINDLVENDPESSLENNIDRLLAEFDSKEHLPADIALTEAARIQSEELVNQVVLKRSSSQARWSKRLSTWTRKRETGIPFAFLVLLVMYFFVGWFGAGILVDLLEGKLFGEVIISVMEGWVSHIPWQWLREMLTGQFGLLTVGLTLSLAIVLPVIATFFFAFAILEDSGYLPRLSLLMDRSLRKIGLNGKGVLPLIMGFSCITMAILATRVLDTRKQRIIATLLLILGIPCAPLLSVMMVLLARLSIWATVVLFGVLLVQFLIVGLIANLLVPGKRPDFILELPPLRIPRLKNILLKTGQRNIWFLKEAIPYFLAGTFILFLLDQAHALQSLRDAVRPVLENIMGLPQQSADVFLMTMIRREAGAALLAQQTAGGLYDGVQVVVTLLVMTLVIPCINSILVMFKERGFWPSIAILCFVIPYSLALGALLNVTCRWLNITF